MGGEIIEIPSGDLAKRFYSDPVHDLYPDGKVSVVCA